MDQGKAERHLTVIYTLCAVFGVIASVTCGISWAHWKETLDQCVGRNCSCILYGYHTPNYFLGGSASSCIWVTFGPIFYILFAISLTCFHGYRVFFISKKQRTRTVTTKNEVGETVQMHVIQRDTTDPLPRAFWIITSILSTFFTVYALVHFSIFTDGYLSTCKEYKKTLEKQIGLHGTIIPVIHDRLSCSAIFDFMDYIQPDSGNAYRDGFMNTALALGFGRAASFFSWILFLYGGILNVKFARQKL